MRVLLVEDDNNLAAALRDRLQRHGAVVTRVATGAAALHHLADAGSGPRTDLVLLDLGLPDMDGLNVCRALRKESDVPIIAVTARAEERDRIAGLRIGADDYVVKPYSTAELMARIEAVMRRSRPVRDPASTTTARHHRGDVTCGSVRLDLDQHEAYRFDERIALTRKEFGILETLTRSAGRVCTREEILDAVWGSALFDSTRTLDVHLATLRAKLGSPPPIRTVRGVGYLLAEGVTAADQDLRTP